MFLNVAIIVFSIGAVWKYFNDPAMSLAVGVLIGGALQFLIQVPSLVRKGMTFKFGLSFLHPGIRDVARLMLPRFFGIGIGQINFFVDTYFSTAARMPGGSLAALYVADRVMELVLGGYAIAVATAILPMMSHQAAAKDFRRPEENADLFRAHRGVYYRAGGDWADDFAGADYSRAVSTRAICGGSPRA